MKKFTYLLLCVLGICVASSCSDDDDNVSLATLTVQLNSEKENVDYTLFQITVTELRSLMVYNCTADDAGNALVNLPYGQYSVVAKDTVNGAATLYGSIESFTFSEQNKLAEINLVNIESTLEKTFVLNELFFNCSSNGSWDNNYYEEYFTILNVSDVPLYADGLSFAICGDYNCVEDDGLKSAYLLRDSIVVSQIYSIPGDGRTYLVQPGEQLVIAHSAIDHTAGGTKPAARNLTGADFEIYVPYEYSMTTDNPDVTNVTVDYSMFQAFSWGYGGYAPMMLLRPDTDLSTYVPAHLANMKVTGAWGNQMQDYLIIPQSWIIDGVEAASADNMLRKVLPVSVDKSYITIADEGMYGGFKNQFIERKSADQGFRMDTNDSANDYVVNVGGQKNYIK
ncbi:MAG: DUF4876 domain-containing protein [Bacteroidales bacterium]|nr:DUF4876 domain-containing protein [Bacteroidales bacterium]